MKTRTLALALMASLSTGVHAHSPPASAPNDSAIHFLRLKALPEAMATTQRDPARWRTPDELRGLSYREAAAEREPVVAWISGDALSDATVRSLASKALHEGIGVLVTSPEGTTRHEAEVFGIEGQGRTSLYRRGKDGVLEVSTLDDTTADVETSQRLYRELAAAPAFRAFARSATLNGADSASDDIPDHVPHERFRYKPISAHGNKVVHDIVVLRDARTSGDSKVIVVKAGVDIAPWDNGVYGKNRPAFERDGIHDFLAIAGRYEFRTLVDWEGKDRGPELRLDRMVPDTSPDVNRSVAKSSQVSTSYGVSTAFKAEDALKGIGISAIGKVPFEFSANRTYTDSTSVSMETESYYIDAVTENYGRAQGVTWNMHLANDVAGSPGYFNAKSKYKVSTAMVTPMMRKASAQLMSVWRVRGDYEGNLLIGTGGRVENRRYGWNRSMGVSWDRSSDVHPDYTADIPWWFWHKGNDPWAHLRQVPAQPTQVVKINLGSPFLTSSPTVLIQSSSGEGLCITQGPFDEKAGAAQLTECDEAESHRAQQWNMDSEGRYRNRESAQCLQIDTKSGTVGTAKCAIRHNQRWKWAADRVVSLMDGGTHHRLEVSNDSLIAKFDAVRHDEVVVNTENALLPPWSNYPLAPSPGSTIPRLSTNSPTVPDSYLSYRRVPATERWQTIPLSR
ncbi:MAG: RICIN domain-containing protein [Luteibacter sp.]|uniref:RICIN domain-containing protein n=1 Tax=Luteibacter sp. TaxID=1886636 RepID=UPI002809B397|nr:RICIN domain-containing protein [Luteibacter sp.]MDQ7994290.1 RICIN domain-containing protein [Luteibacter sp.]MDQ8048590.1 RICIN domain-containing protein [Luteibacter sp.]